jgi:hypothetical protein
VKKKNTINGSRHELHPEFDLVDVTGNRHRTRRKAKKCLGMLSLSADVLLCISHVTVARKIALLCC